MKTYRVGLVGCGGMGRHHLSVLKNLSEFKIVAICDLRSVALKNFGDQFQIDQRYTDFEEMHDLADLDIVVVATQTRGHCQPTVSALRRGIHVICEKPIAIDLTEADQMISASIDSGTKLAIHQQNHVHPAILKALEIIDEIGDLVMVRGRNKAGRKSGNEFMEMGTHVTDMMMRFGGVPQWCSGAIYCGDRLAEVGEIMESKEMSPNDRDSGLVMGTRAIAHYGFENGVMGEIRFIDYSPAMSENYGIDLLGTKGQITIRTSASREESLWILPRAMAGKPSQFTDWRLIEIKDQNPVVTMYRRFVEAIETDTEPPSSGLEGRLAFEMIIAIYQSHRLARRVDLPLIDRRHPLEAWKNEIG